MSYIQKHGLSEADKSILGVLSFFEPLPLSALISIYNDDDEQSHDKLYNLIDRSLVQVEDGRYYKISSPIKDSVAKIIGFPSAEILNRILPKLIDAVEQADDMRKLQFSRAISLLSYYLNDKSAQEKGIKLKSDFIKLVEQAYHQRRYKDAITLGAEAIQEVPDDSTARNFYIKALIQEEKWDAALKQLNELYAIDSPQNVHFLKGFLFRKKGDLQKAIKELKESKSLGRKGVSLDRELAHCYLIIEDFGLALSHISNAIKAQPDNGYLIDMAAKIAIRMNDFKTAEKHLKLLSVIDGAEYYYMRSSSYH